MRALHIPVTSMAISLGVTVMQLCKILQFRLEYFDREDYMCLTFVFLKKTVILFFVFHINAWDEITMFSTQMDLVQKAIAMFSM